jgi:phage terminase small subunit
MGRRGPKPQPTALKLARGTPGHHAVNHDEPQFDAPSETTPPDVLTGYALEEWTAQIDTLIAKGVMTEQALFMFREYCMMAGEIDSLERHLAKTTRWTPQRIKLSKHLLAMRTRATAQAAHFGLTPSSSSGVKASPPPNASDDKRRRFFGARKEKPA